MVTRPVSMARRSVVGTDSGEGKQAKFTQQLEQLRAGYAEKLDGVQICLGRFQNLSKRRSSVLSL